MQTRPDDGLRSWRLVVADEWLVPCRIFFAEMCVVTFGTLRIIFIARGRKFLAPCLGFFEVTIWLFAITQVMSQVHNLWCFLAFAAGFSTGNLLGILIENALAMGMAMVRVIVPPGAEDLVQKLRDNDFGVTSVNGQGARGPVQIILTVIRRRQLKKVLTLVESVQPGAFYQVDELQSVSEGIFPMPARPGGGLLPGALRMIFKGPAHGPSFSEPRPQGSGFGIGNK